MEDLPPDTAHQLPERRGVGCNMLMLLILLVLVAGTLIWAMASSPPDTPQPSGTGVPATAPVS